MIWFYSSLAGAFFSALYFALIKKEEERMDYIVLIGAVYLLIALILGAGLFLTGIPEIGEGFAGAFLGMLVLNIGTTFLFLEALKISDISISLPMTAFTPLFLIFTSPLINGEFADGMGIYGILLIVAGSYILHLKEEKGIMGPLKSIIQNKGSLYMLIVAFIWSFSANFDKIAYINSNSFFYGTFLYLGMGLFFAVYALMKKKDIARQVKKGFPGIVKISASCILTFLLITFSYSFAIVPYVISIKRMSALFGVVLGGVMFKEKNIGVRFIGALVMVAGAVTIALGT
ncbi:EamA family transporter [Candidatus Micrarchaeota archaeon]|nr:EamA family transporter [Candidatus Micrarchaeota archaeon]